MTSPIPRATRLSCISRSDRPEPGRAATRITTVLGDRAAGQVVQQPQGRLVGLVQVVHDQQQPAPGGRQSQQLGGGHEQPLVGGLPVPR